MPGMIQCWGRRGGKGQSVIQSGGTQYVCVYKSGRPCMVLSVAHPPISYHTLKHALYNISDQYGVWSYRNELFFLIDDLHVNLDILVCPLGTLVEHPVQHRQVDIMTVLVWGGQPASEGLLHPGW